MVSASKKHRLNSKVVFLTEWWRAIAIRYLHSKAVKSTRKKRVLGTDWAGCYVQQLELLTGKNRKQFSRATRVEIIN